MFIQSRIRLKQATRRGRFHRSRVTWCLKLKDTGNQCRKWDSLDKAMDRLRRMLVYLFGSHLQKTKLCLRVREDTKLPRVCLTTTRIKWLRFHKTTGKVCNSSTCPTWIREEKWSSEINGRLNYNIMWCRSLCPRVAAFNAFGLSSLWLDEICLSI